MSVSEKPQCHVCGSRRQRNLFVIPEMTDAEFLESQPPLHYNAFIKWVKKYTERKKRQINIKYVCYRCFYLKPSPESYRYRDLREKVEANATKRVFE